jgi:hypothetical protein
MSSSSLLGKLHITLAPMNGALSFFVGFDTTDVNRISNGANTVKRFCLGCFLMDWNVC